MTLFLSFVSVQEFSNEQEGLGKKNKNRPLTQEVVLRQVAVDKQSNQLHSVTEQPVLSQVMLIAALFHIHEFRVTVIEDQYIFYLKNPVGL